MTIFGRQPAFWIGLIVTLVLGVVQTLTGNGLISEVTAGQTTDLVNSTAQLLVLLAPLIAGLLIRTQVTPVANPSLPQGTRVEVVTPEGQPNLTTTL
jgi:uncharacterized membrane protein